MNTDVGALQNDGEGTPNGDPNSNAPKKSKAGGIFSYIFLPGIIPQIRELAKGGFGYLALLIATVYQAVRILPKDHPYTKFENLGSFGIRQVIATAADNVKLNRKNLDQVIIFFAVLAGIIILALQFIAFLILIFSGEAWAADAAAANGGLFSTANPQTDIAFHMLREVFGIPDLFGTLDGGPKPIHEGLHVMLNFYNLAILVVAILVFIYYVIVVVGETAQSGTPFGQRFSHVYAPFRLVIAIGLLVPLNHGLNGAQYIALYAAKMGSGFATTGWSQFTDALSNPLGAENATLIAETQPPDFQGLVEFMATAVACSEGYKLKEPNRNIQQICAQEVGGKLERTTCDGAASLGTQQDIKIVFGELDGIGNQRIIPTCGIVTLPISTALEETETSGEPGELQKAYLSVVEALWTNEKLKTDGENFALAHSKKASDPKEQYYGGGTTYTPPPSRKAQILSEIKNTVNLEVKAHYERARDTADFEMGEETKELGWGGAGIWYNRIAQINGAYVVVTMGMPAADKWPKVMEFVLDEKKKGSGTFASCKTFDPNLGNNKKVDFSKSEIDAYYAGMMNEVYQYWTCQRKNTHNFYLDSISAVFGLQGLLAIRDDAPEEGVSQPLTAQTHPLAKLSALGRGLVEAAIRNLAIAMGSSFLGGALGIISPQGGAAFDAASSALVSIATIGLSIGFITYYILPFLPFIYFFFAVGAWVKSIFEAMVGAPLWALAHLRIDGDGIPGKMAINGYFLIFEIFLRPILTIFGLLGGMAIFTALAAMLNEIFSIVVLQTGGVNLDQDVGQFEFSTHVVDIFFFTVVYAVILYMMATASFKMINLVPNNILRWLGQSVQSFSDNEQDPTGNLVQYAAIGGARIGGQLAGGVTQLSKAGGGVLGGVFGLAGIGGQAQAAPPPGWVQTQPGSGPVPAPQVIPNTGGSTADLRTADNSDSTDSSSPTIGKGKKP